MRNTPGRHDERRVRPQNAVRALVLVVCALTSMDARADIDASAGYKCLSTSSPEKVIRNFIDHQIIYAREFDNTDGVPTYQAKAAFSAFGYQLVAVTAWQDNSKMFGRGPGTRPEIQYTMIVKGDAPAVQSAVARRGVQVLDPRTNPSPPFVRNAV